jgi:cell division protein FtsL|tara:strand:+ start:4 stop:273 length:270 start_codon:yes stop_codon:yes gene_type:complete
VASPLRIALLWILVVVSALSVAFVSHLCREKYSELTAMEREANQLQVDYGKYLLEQSAWGSLQRIENMAAKNLQMHSPLPEEILMIKRQ